MRISTREQSGGQPGLVIWGAGGHALVVADIVRLEGRYQLVGFVDDVHPERRGQAFGGARILGGAEQLAQLQADGVHTAIIAIGDCGARASLAAQCRERGYYLGTAVHPRAILAADVGIGHGSVIAAGAVINPGTRVGANVIVNTSASVDHECVLEDAVHVGPGTHLGGNVHVKRGTWIGIGASVRDGRTIGEHSLVGAGAVVVDDIPDHVVAFGIPARVKRPLQ